MIEFDKKLSLEKITGDLLYEYENWMLAKGKSITTVGIYLRSLRAVFNEAIDEGFMPKEFYPFGKKKYQIPTGKNIKKALSLVDIGKFYSFRKKKKRSELYCVFKGKGLLVIQLLWKWTQC